MISFFDVREQYLDNQKQIDHEMQYAMSTGQMFDGEHLHFLQTAIYDDYDDRFAVTLTNSGTSALIAALLALDLPAGSGVLMPTLTYAATAQAVLAAGLKPIFVDVDAHCLMSFHDLVQKFERFRPHVSAVLVVDLYGQRTEMSQLASFCHEHDLPLVVDAAQSYGNTANIHLADIICLSFNPLKNWGGTGGGAVLTKRHLEKLRQITHCGTEKGRVVTFGTNMRMDKLQAAVLFAKRNYWDHNRGRKRKTHAIYHNELKDIMPLPTPWSGWHDPYVSVIFPKNPEKVRVALMTAGIEFRSHYDTPLHHEEFFHKGTDWECPYADSLAGRAISLPNHYHLVDDDVDWVISVVKAAL